MKTAKFMQPLRIFFTLAIILTFFSSWPVTAQGGEETEHQVDAVFAAYFDKFGGREIFGYPITESFQEQGVLMQYFQKVRMEYRATNPNPYKIQLGLLGDELKYRHAPVPAPSPPSRRKAFFPETGHTISYAFLDYFNTHGGIDIFGYPITEMFFEEGKIVQYFQRLKMEWYPDDPTVAVRIGNLGELYVSIYRDRIPLGAFNRVVARPDTGQVTGQGITTNANVTSIKAVVSLRYSVMNQKRNQEVSVLVTDNNSKPVSSAMVMLTLEMVDGTVLSGSSFKVVTDARGFVQASIPVNSDKTGTQVIVRAQVTYGTLKTTAQNVFLVWW